MNMIIHLSSTDVLKTLNNNPSFHYLIAGKEKQVGHYFRKWKMPVSEIEWINWDGK